jgi:hypothetical protein
MYTCFSKMSFDFQQATRHYIPKDRTHNHRCQNLLSSIVYRAVILAQPDHERVQEQTLVHTVRNLGTPYEQRVCLESRELASVRRVLSCILPAA